MEWISTILDFLELHNGVCSIILSVVAIIIAICSSNSTSKAANKQILKLTNLSLFQLRANILTLETEILNIDFKMFEAKEKMIDAKTEATSLMKEMKEMYNHPQQIGKKERIQKDIKTFESKYSVQYSWWIDLAKHQSHLIFQRNDLVEEYRMLIKEGK